ncbi:MAG: CBS domain-containing protein [Chloroflexota bacterium]
MISNAKIQDYMTPAITVSTTTPIRVAQQIMEDRHIRHLPVVKEDKLVGILSSGDIRRAGPSSTSTLSMWEIASLWEKTTVEQEMSRHVISVRPETLVTTAVQLMMTHRFNSLPVVDSENRPIGIVTEVDVFRLFLDVALATTPVPASELG